ncbi:MAG: hypothetical protein Q9167_003039 [Letrouitia subvulpina]
MVPPSSTEDIVFSAPDEQTTLLVPNPAGDDEESSLESKSTKDIKSTTGILGIILVLVLEVFAAEDYILPQGAFIANADGSIVVATYGTISSEIDRLENGNWLVITYGLAQCAIQPTVSEYTRSFYAQCPLAIIAIVLVAWKLDEPSSSRPSDEGELQSKTGKLRRIDFLGSASLACAIVGFLLILDLSGQKVPWTHPFVWIIVAIALFFGALFVLIEAFVAQEPIFPLRLLVHQDVVTAYIVTALQGTAQFGHFLMRSGPQLVYTVPIYFQVTARVSVANAGAHFVPSFLGNTVGSIFAGIVIKR